MSARLSIALRDDVLRKSATLRLLAGCERGSGTGCWLWQKATNDRGYAVLRVFKRPHGSSLASRVSFTLFRAEVPDEAFVCHRCDTPACVNPMHLFIGTQQDNMTDMKRKGRQRSLCGDDSPFSKVTAEDVIEIRRRYGQGDAPLQIAKDHGLTYNAVRMIAVGENWKHIPGACARRGYRKKHKLLTDAQLREASGLQRQGHTYASLAQQHGVTHNVMYQRLLQWRKRASGHGNDTGPEGAI